MEAVKTKNIGLRCPLGLIEIMDAIVETGLYKDRSEFILEAIRGKFRDELFPEYQDKLQLVKTTLDGKINRIIIFPKKVETDLDLNSKE